MKIKKEHRRRTAQLERVQKNRMEHMRRLRERFPTIREFCEATSMGTALYHAVAGPNPTRRIGEGLARDVERILGLPNGAMDLDVKPPHQGSVRARLRDLI